MRRSRQIAIGGMALVGGQLVVSVLQVFYSGLTSRNLSPSAFGAFSVAISATGLAALLVTTGLAAYVVSRPEFDASTAAAVSALSWGAGVGGAIVLFVSAPVWAAAWNADGAVPLTRFLALQVLVASPAAVQSALLRREGRPTADAISLVTSTALGMIVGVFFVVRSRNDLALGVSPLVSAAAALLLAACLRRQRYGFSWPARYGAILRYSWSVSSQNIVFFLLLSLPVWAVSVAAGPADLGYFSRAALITGLPSTALATALTRAVQPFYRHMTTRPAQQRALMDACAVTSLIAFPAFAGLAAVGPSLVTVWLGQGWGKAGGLVAPLAVGYGLYVVYTLLANAAETIAEFRAVRHSQIAMALPATILTVIVVVSNRVEFAAWIMLAISLCGTAVLMRGLGRVGLVVSSEVFVMLARHARWSLAIALAAVVTQLGVREIGHPEAVWQLLSGTLIGLSVAIVSLRKQPGWSVLENRGIVRGRFNVKNI